MRVHILFSLIVVFVLSCQSNTSYDTGDYPAQFGEIPFDPNLDDSSFKLCDATQLVHSRTSLSYKGGRPRINEITKASFASHGKVYDYNGYVLVRFLVNCNGKVGRLRFEYLDAGFMEQKCPEGLIALIAKSVEALNQWTIATPSNRGKDHSKYLNFKILNGQIDAIIH